MPYDVGPWWKYRHEVKEEMLRVGSKPGDILVRRGGAFLYGAFPFSDFICYLTNSKYSHAAMVIEVNSKDILIADVDQKGLRRQFFEEWTDDMRGNDFAVLRVNDPDIAVRAADNARKLIELDHGYDYGFAQRKNQECNFYCTELVCWSYMRAGLKLCDDTKIEDLPNWKSWMFPLAYLEGIDPRAGVWHVGSSKSGILSSPYLYVHAIMQKPKIQTKKPLKKELI